MRNYEEKILGMRERNEAEVGEERFTFFEQESQMNADTAFKRKKLVRHLATGKNGGFNSLHACAHT